MQDKRSKLITKHPASMFYISYLGLLIALLLFLYRNKELGNNYSLSIFYFFNSIFGIVHNVIFTSESPSTVAFFTNHFMPFYFLVGPSVYFFIKKTYISNKRRSSDFLHLIPFILVFINISPHIFIPWSEKIEIAKNTINDISFQYDVKFLFMSSITQSILRPAINLIYGLVGTYLFFKNLDRRLFKNEQMNNAFCWWTGGFLFVFLLSNLSSLLLVGNMVLRDTIHLNVFKVLPVDIVQGLVMFAFYVQNLCILFIPFILFGTYFKSEYVVEKHVQTIHENAEKQNLQQLDLGILNEEKILEISDALKKITAKDDYLANDFSLSKLALEINTPYHVLTVYFSKYLKVSFPEWKNRQRIEFVKDKLKSGAANSLTLESIGEMAGFNSRGAFIKVFKKYMGETPSEYLKKL